MSAPAARCGGKARCAGWGRVALALVAAAACNSRPTAPTVQVTAIEPAEGAVGESVAVAILGSGFKLGLASDFDDGTADSAGIEVTVGGVALEQLVVRDTTRIEGIVPGTLPVAAHDVVVATVNGGDGSLSRGFTVFRVCSSDPECDDDPCASTETCVNRRCVSGPVDKDSDGDGFIDAACGGDDCDDDDQFENPNATWYPDGDGDGDGDSNSLGSACQRAAASDVANANDCDDSNPAVSGGTACDDADACTVGDVCAAGICAGVDTCTCDPSCSGGCTANGCCAESCSGKCTDCSSSCSCDYDCTAGACATTCGSESVCRMTATSTDSAQLGCSNGATCSLECAGVPDCTMTCASDALCLLNCGGASVCDLTCSGDTAVDCGNGVLVCHRDCP